MVRIAWLLFLWGYRFTLRLNAPLAFAVVLHAVDSYAAAAIRTLLWARVAYATGFRLRAAWSSLVNGVEALDPEGLAIPHVLHVKVGVFFQEFDLRTFMGEDFIRCTPTSFASFIFAFLTTVVTHADVDLALSRTHIAFVKAGCGDFVDATDEGDGSATVLKITRVAMAF